MTYFVSSGILFPSCTLILPTTPSTFYYLLNLNHHPILTRKLLLEINNMIAFGYYNFYVPPIYYYTLATPSSTPEPQPNHLHSSLIKFLGDTSIPHFISSSCPGPARRCGQPSIDRGLWCDRLFYLGVCVQDKPEYLMICSHNSSIEYLSVCLHIYPIYCLHMDYYPGSSVEESMSRRTRAALRYLRGWHLPVTRQQTGTCAPVGINS